MPRGAMQGFWWFETLLFSCIGLGFFLYGKKQREPSCLLAGIGLSILPAVIKSALVMGGVGVLLVGGPFVWRRLSA